MSPYQVIKQQIYETAEKCQRNPNEISLVAVTKQRSIESIQDLYDQGQRDFGENRVNEALEKQNLIPNESLWHLIGNLQSNKIKKIIGRFSLIHSVNSFELAQKLSYASEEANLITPILLQVNTSGELSKQGHSPTEWKNFFEKIIDLKNIDVQGLMTMAPLTDDKQIIKLCFQKLKLFRNELNTVYHTKMRHLSMGMSNDFKIAIEEGATILRIGSALFS